MFKYLFLSLFACFLLNVEQDQIQNWVKTENK